MSIFKQIITGGSIPVTYSAVNYTPTAATVDGNLEGIDDKFGTITNPLLFKGSITLPADFPTVADVQNGWTFTITADVTDNDGTKTNTGDSFIAGDEIAWNGTDWTVLGNELIWTKSGTVVSPAVDGNTLSLGDTANPGFGTDPDFLAIYGGDTIGQEASILLDAVDGIGGGYDARLTLNGDISGGGTSLIQFKKDDANEAEVSLDDTNFRILTFNKSAATTAITIVSGDVTSGVFTAGNVIITAGNGGPSGTAGQILMTGATVLNDASSGSGHITIKSQSDSTRFSFRADTGRLGMGVSASPNTDLDIAGGIGLQIVSVLNAASPYSVLATDYTILADAVGGAITINLAAAADNARRIINIKKVDATANTITIDANSGEFIDGALTQVITVQYDSITIQCNGTNWFII